jgi:serine/threonine-protein kinase
MSPEYWDRLELLLERATTLPPAERDAFVARETSDEPALRAELTALLLASDGAEEYVSRLRLDLLGSGVQDILREAAAAPDGPDPWIGRTVSHYEIVERLGGGGMGVIYQARDTRLDRIVALKFIAPGLGSDAAARQRFGEEARAASALDHPNICTIHDIGETAEGRQFIVMAAYQGETLRSRLDRPPMPAPEALDIARQVARALAAAHERGIVHRDVKPDNIFVTREGVVKLLDFGLARMADHRMSGPGTMVGTVAYMSPEQVEGRRADSRSDVWALGVILFEALSGRRPFSAGTPGEVLDLIREREPDFAALGPAAAAPVVAVIRRALAKAPEQRFADGRELLEALAGAPVALGGPVAGRRVRRLGVLAAGLLVVGTVALLQVRTDRGGIVAAAPAPPGSAGEVLWVDDNPGNNAGVIGQLEKLGVRVTTAVSTAEGLKVFDPAVHRLVISDMGRFEGVGDTYVERAGFDLLAGLHARHPGQRMFFCTSARAVTSYRAEALAAGALAISEDCSQALGFLGLPSP